MANAIGSSPLLRRHNLTSAVSFCRRLYLRSPAAQGKRGDQGDGTDLLYGIADALIDQVCAGSPGDEGVGPARGSSNLHIAPTEAVTR